MPSTRHLMFPAQKMLLVYPIFLCYCLCLISAKADTVCDTPIFCTVMSWHSWEECVGGCGNITYQTRHRYLCFNEKIFQQPTRELVMNYCNVSHSYPMSETRPCTQCPYGKYNITTKACEICKNIKCSDLPCKHGVCFDTTAGFRCDCESGYSGIDCSEDIADELELPIWLPKLEIALLVVISMTILMTMGCLCLRCCKLCGCSSTDDDDEEEEERKAKPRKNHRQIPKSSGKSFDF